MDRRAYWMQDRKLGDCLVEITHIEDRVEYKYVTYRPVVWLDGERVENASNMGVFGCRRWYPNTETFRPAGVVVSEAPMFGVGVRAGHTVEK